MEDKILDKVFFALSDNTRRSILNKLKEREYTVLELAGYYDISFQAVSKHLKVLDKAGLIHRRKHGRSYYCSFNVSSMNEALYWISQQREFWDSGFDSLDAFLQKNKKNER